MTEHLTTITTAITGGVIWEGFKFLHPEVKRYFTTRREASKIFYENLDPILKSASELYGKLESLAKEDFSSFINLDNSNSIDPLHNQKYVFYLFAQFWAQIEYLRLESQYTDLSKIKKGKELLRFIETIESRKFRILDRSIQRILGECLIKEQGHRFRVMSLKEFTETLDTSKSKLSQWLENLKSTLFSTNKKEARQLILRFGVIIAILIDHFDPNYKTVRRREIYTNKLSKKSKSIIRNNLTNHYLSFISKKDRYY
ncbi:hypothetical protein [Flavobacterium commune]|uniref:Uncharacterized protein n=1 Tax=Flavobacterium commune TaxID=1306519 RepID=A0A1D9PA71_9FLAO|nr:hypothetical protein [Flavobacterium commune]AOZ99422.1 hypothetical protein BIW12_08180 [Flavobacterium commune]